MTRIAWMVNSGVLSWTTWPAIHLVALGCAQDRRGIGRSIQSQWIRFEFRGAGVRKGLATRLPRIDTHGAVWVGTTGISAFLQVGAPRVVAQSSLDLVLASVVNKHINKSPEIEGYCTQRHTTILFPSFRHRWNDTDIDVNTDRAPRNRPPVCARRRPSISRVQIPACRFEAVLALLEKPAHPVTAGWDLKR